MQPVNLKDAETQLAKLIEAAAEGEDVIITRSDGTAFKIVPVASAGVTPKFGSARGLVKVLENFDEPVEAFEDYAP